MVLNKFGQSDTAAATSSSSALTRGPRGIGFKFTSEGDYDIENKRLKLVREPLDHTDAVNKQYLDEAIATYSKDLTSKLTDLEKFKSIAETQLSKGGQTVNTLEEHINKLNEKIDDDGDRCRRLEDSVKTKFEELNKKIDTSVDSNNNFKTITFNRIGELEETIKTLSRSKPSSSSSSSVTDLQLTVNSLKDRVDKISAIVAFAQSVR